LPGVGGAIYFLMESIHFCDLGAHSFFKERWWREEELEKYIGLIFNAYLFDSLSYANFSSESKPEVIEKPFKYRWGKSFRNRAGKIRR
jgi:hypothetical protein